MFYIACNLFGELAWDLKELPCGFFRRQLATRLWGLDELVAFCSGGGTSLLPGTTVC